MIRNWVPGGGIYNGDAFTVDVVLPCQTNSFVNVELTTATLIVRAQGVPAAQ